MVAQSPYVIDTPVYGNRFVGRKDKIDIVMSNVLRGNSCSISGERRIGRTSLLLKLNELVEKEKDYLAVYVDARVFCEFNQSRFLFEIIRSALEDEKKMDNLKDRFLTSFENRLYQEFSTKYIKNNVSFLQLKDILEEISKEKLLVIFIDDFDILLHLKRIDLNFLSFLRYLATNLRIPFIVSTCQNINIYKPDSIVASPFYNILVQYRLGLFSTDEASELIHKPAESSEIRINRETEDYIKELGGQHPYLLNLACHHTFKKLTKSGDYQPTQKEIDYVRSIILDNMLLYYPPTSLSKKENEILKELRKTDFEDRYSKINSLDRISRHIAIRLLEKGLVTAWGDFHSD